MSNDAPLTNYFSTEIEEAAVSMLWRNKDYCAQFLRDCNPLTHLQSPPLRTLVHAINLSQSELGATDFAGVVQTVRELGAMDELGGLDELNRIYAIVEPTHCSSQLFPEYVRLLKMYADNRAITPLKPLYAFTGGQGRAYINLDKTKGKYIPDYSGPVQFQGQIYKISLNVAQKGEFVNVRIEPHTR